MEAAAYEEGYFKLKKSNEELVTLLNKVINDLKLSKISYKSEKDKNAALSSTNGNISTELIKVTRQCEDQSKTITDLNQELDYLKSYSKAVEGVAENYCGKSITTQKKYDQLKRQSSIFFSSHPDQPLFDINLVDDDMDSNNCATPVPILEIEEIKTNHEEIINKEKCRYENLRKDFLGSKNEIIKLRNEIDELMETIKDKDMNVTKLNGDLDIMLASYNKLKGDHEQMLKYFEPFIRIKAENNDLKRTSALLLNSVAGDEKIMEFLNVIDNLKTEIIDKNNKISNLEVKLLENDQSTITIELTAVRTEIEELTGKLENLKKERDLLKHENRILLEQKGGCGIAPPAPPPPPPPPPPSKIMNIFKKGTKKIPQSSTPKKENDEVVCNLMKELEKKLLEKLQGKHSLKPPNSPSVKSVDYPDNKQNPFTVHLRKQSLPSLPILQNKKKNELDEVFEKKKEKKTGNSPFLKKTFDSIDSSSSSTNLRKKSLPNMNQTKNCELDEVGKKSQKRVPRISEEKKDGSQDDQQNNSDVDDIGNQRKWR